MHVWAGYAQKKIRQCRFCKQSISKGEKIWRARNYSWKKWRADYYYHFDPQLDYPRSCHDMEGVAWFETHEDIGPPVRLYHGRPKMDLTLEQRNKRKSLRVRAYQIRKDMVEISDMRLTGWEDRFKEKNSHYYRIKEEMKEYGGAPSNWP